MYFYIPTLNIQSAVVFSHNGIPEGLSFGAVSLILTSVVKFDNIKLSVIQSLPPYILSTSEKLATKFNMYPQVTNVININNSENMLVNQVSIYDIASKQLST